MNDDAGGRRRPRRMRWPRTGLLAIVAGAALLTAACSGGSSSTPQVASLGTSSSTGGGSSAGAVPNGNATRLLDEWASCARTHGDPHQTDPTINADKDIEITMPVQVSQALSSQAHDSSGPCGSYLTAAQDALGYTPPVQSSDAQQLKYAECMRAHGVPKYPDPVYGSAETNLRGIGMSPTSPIFLKADDLCSKENGMHAADAPALPGIVQVQSAGLPGNGAPPNRGVLPSNGSGANG
jgi:hypothetical protein